MLVRYVTSDLVRNPRRTLSTMVGVTLGVGLFCGVLFFVDGLSASMTQRAVAPLPIDIQRIVTERVGGALALSQRFEISGVLTAGARSRVILEVRNPSATAAHEVTVRSRPATSLVFVPGSAQLDGQPLTGFDDNPFDHGAAGMGFNLGTVAAGEARSASYIVEAGSDVELGDAAIASSFSSRESVSPVAANEASSVPLADLVRLISQVNGVEHASQLSLADLGADTISLNGTVAPGPSKILGFDADYADRDAAIRIVEGDLRPGGAVISAEAAQVLGAHIGDVVTVRLPDASTFDATVSGIADLSRSRSLFSSRRGGDLETFIYSRNSIIVSPAVFADTVQPAYERAATTRGERLKNPPIREIDIKLQRELLNADPATALQETRRIAADVSAVAAHQDYLLDNISNTLAVAAADAGVAKRLFVFLGVPGLFLAIMLAGYAGTVLADAQRREAATLRIRGASRRHLLRMHTVRTGLLTGAGSAAGLVMGYLTTAAILGQESLARASVASIATSALLGCVGGFVATGFALYLTGRRTIDQEIAEDHARYTGRPPLWRRTRLDIVGLVVVAAGTALAIRARAFDGEAGSVYFGRAVELNTSLLVLPVAVWITGTLLAGRLFGSVLGRTQPRSSSSLGRPLPSLYRLSIGRRPWAIANGAIAVSLIVALATCLAAFTASYDAAKARDAQFATGSDIRITPTPTSKRPYAVEDGGLFRTDGVAATTPVIYGVSNVILRSARTSDPANLAAVDPATFAVVAPLVDEHFDQGDAATALQALADDPTAVLVSRDMASFLKAKPGDTLHVLLVRATPEQVEVDLRITGLFDRLPGFPDGADALMSIHEHTAVVPSKAPDFFLAAAARGDDAGLQRALASIEQGPAAQDHLQIDTRATMLARDQSSLAALNVAGLANLDSTFSLAMAVVAIAIFVFGLLLQRRREYVTLRAQGLEARTVGALIVAEASTVAVGGTVAGLIVGAGMGFYFVAVLRPLFVLDPTVALPVVAALMPVALVAAATVVAS
ncbi:MAG: ABC transporter permease, partial [Chloroflexota bacterium]|nr:ABC transporter permease [Chloroflexota bacterium]